MKALGRLNSGGRVDRARQLGFWFNGKQYTGFEGDTLASALLANGVALVARSWKYHRPRGVLSAGVEEPNALVQLFDGERTIPNAKATEISLVDGLRARSINASPSPTFDWRSINGLFSRLLPAGFYYKTFMHSPAVWQFFEQHIRRAGGLGESPDRPDPDRYDKRFVHCDVLIAGAGIAGLMAALAAARTGARVIIADEQAEPGGWLLSSAELIDGQPAALWLTQTLNELHRLDSVRILTRATVYGYHEHNFLTIAQRRSDHLPTGLQPIYRERLYKVRANQVVLATGAHERPMVFANNDMPGIMLASAVSTYTRRYGVRLAEKAMVFTNNDLGYDAALALHAANVRVKIIDARRNPVGSLSRRARALGIQVTTGFVVTEATGWQHLRQVTIQPLSDTGKLTGSAHAVDCDLLAVSSGFSPLVHLYCQSGGRPVWDDQRLQFVPGEAVQSQLSAGACAGEYELAACARDGAAAGFQAALRCGLTGEDLALPDIERSDPGSIRPLWRVPHRRGINRSPKQFVDFQNDVCAADIALAVREGFESIEHVKRYTVMGFGTDQGKTGNVNGMAIAAGQMGKTIDDVGTTTFRPNYTPVTFGAIAGIELGDCFEPVRTTPLHRWHQERGAQFEDVGQFKRPWYYPEAGESMGDAVNREVRAAREQVAVLDASTLGKIDIQGPDAVRLLDWVYCNAWSSLKVGKCRYGLMLDENGMVFDDGVTVRLGEQHYLMHTTTGGAARVLAWMERWLQTEWPELKVYLTSVTDHWATVTITGPDSRQVLGKLAPQADLSDQAFGFMSMQSMVVGGMDARVLRVSFSGELSYEINVPAPLAQQLWQAVFDAGQSFGITPYGTETMHVLRAEKGFIIVGQDTDGSVTPVDLGMERMVSPSKDFLGKRSLQRSDTARDDRKQLVGLRTEDPAFVIPEGSQLLESPSDVRPATMIGHVSSAYWSPSLDHSIALALVKGGRARMGEQVSVALRTGGWQTATICNAVFYDPNNERQHV